MNESLAQFNDDLSYFASMGRKFYSAGDVNDEMQRTLFYLQKMMSISDSLNEPEMFKKVEELYNKHAAKFGFK